MVFIYEVKKEIMDYKINRAYFYIKRHQKEPPPYSDNNLLHIRKDEMNGFFLVVFFEKEI